MRININAYASSLMSAVGLALFIAMLAVFCALGAGA